MNITELITEYFNKKHSDKIFLSKSSKRYYRYDSEIKKVVWLDEKTLETYIEMSICVFCRTYDDYTVFEIV